MFVESQQDGRIEALAVVASNSAEREQLVGELQTAGPFPIISAASVEALAVPHELHPFALLLSMDRQCGVTTLTRIVEQARAQHAPRALVIVGNVPAVVAFEAARAGADALLLKPFTVRHVLSLFHGADASLAAGASVPSLARAEWEYLQYVLELCEGNRSRAARCLGIHRSVLQRKLSRHPPVR